MQAKPDQTVPPYVRHDWDYASEQEPKLLSFLQDFVFRKWVSDSSRMQDLQQATDYTIRSPGELNIAVRVRRLPMRHRDLTIRAERPSGMATELEKLKSGCVDIYLYGWFEPDGLCREYMIVCMRRMRLTGLLDRPDTKIWNRDRSSRFYCWRWQTLQDEGVLLEHVSKTGPVLFRTECRPIPLQAEPGGSHEQ